MVKYKCNTCKRYEFTQLSDKAVPEENIKKCEVCDSSLTLIEPNSSLEIKGESQIKEENNTMNKEKFMYALGLLQGRKLRSGPLDSKFIEHKIGFLTIDYINSVALYEHFDKVIYCDNKYTIYSRLVHGFSREIGYTLKDDSGNIIRNKACPFVKFIPETEIQPFALFRQHELFKN